MFMDSVHQRVGPQAMVNNLADWGAEDMPQNDACKDDSKNGETFPGFEEEPEVTPPWGDQYLNAEILSQEETNWYSSSSTLEVWCHW